MILLDIYPETKRVLRSSTLVAESCHSITDSPMISGLIAEGVLPKCGAPAPNIIRLSAEWVDIKQVLDEKIKAE